MKTLLSLLMLSTAAVAADIPIKAPAPNALFAGYPYAGQGFYFGLNTIGGAGSANVDVPGVNSNSLTTTQASIGGTIGYVWATTSVFYAVEAMFDITNFNGSEQGLALGGPAHFEQRFKIGTPLVNVMNILPSFGLPAVPPFPALPDGAVATNIHPYLMGGVHEDDISIDVGLSSGKAWRIAPSVGVGMMGQLTKGVAIDTWIETRFPTNQICVGTDVCVKQGQMYLVGLGLYY